MSTASLTHPGAEPHVPALGAVRTRSERFSTALAVSLLLVILYAVFSHGAVSRGTEARLQVAIDAIAAIAGAAWLWSGALNVRASRAAIAGIASLSLFTLWSGVTLAWSVAPEQTWLELNRAIAYVLVLGLGVALGSSTRRAYQLLADGFVLIVLAACAYAVGQKTLPGLHVTGVFDLNQTGPLPRLQEPLGYWNALALLVAYGAPLALARTVDSERSGRARDLALIALELMLLTIGLTYSRGGLIALAAGLVVGIALSGARLRSIMWFAVAALATLPPLIFGLASHSLNTANMTLSSREGAGLILLGLLILSIAILVLAARWLREFEGRSHITPLRARRIARLLMSLLGLAIVITLIGFAFSSRGLTGTFSHAWTGFTSTRVTSTYDPQRLLSTSSENRWVWWKEAMGAFSDRPVAGWGAGSFRVVHLLYRRDRLTVNQPHNVLLQFMAETGLIGALLAVFGFVLLVCAALRRIRSHPPGRERSTASALFAAVVIFLVHSFYDWDWDIPAVTLPALLFLGVLVGYPRARPVLRRPTLGLRGLAVALLTLTACVIAASDVLPSIAASRASAAVVEAAGSAADAQKAQASAALATRLDPVSDAGLLVEATIALRRGRLHDARTALLEAIAREPSDIAAWRQLAFVEFVIGDLRAGREAQAREVALDPISGTPAPAGTGSPALSRTPPSDSATAQPVR